MLLKFNEVDRKQMDMLFSPQILKALQNKGFIDIKKKSNPLSESEVIPNSEQELAIRRVSNAVVKGKGGEFLLYGVTGSGKTEVYINLSQTAIAHGKGVIILIPEIALTRQLLEQFAARIKDVAVLHSAMSSGERYDEWKRIKRGEAKLVIGARSAVFAPVTNLGLIIIDEEQEHTFKQEEFPRYHAREVAQERVRMENAVLLYGSATPSIETFHSAAEGTSTLLTINNRVAGAMVPTVIIEDLRISFKGGHRGLISPLLRDKIAQKVNNKEQSILFINRR